MLNGLLEVASADAGTAELQCCETDVASLVREIHDIIAPQASDKGLGLDIAIDEMLLGSWLVDPMRLRQVLLNLSGNAVKYTTSGKVGIRAAIIPSSEGQTFIR